MRVGELEVKVVSGGSFRLDGGGMFGVVPRVLWQRRHAPDDRGRIALDTNCLLVRAGHEVVLLDTGNGQKLAAREREIFSLRDGEGLLPSLAALGVSPEDITLVLLTHLHLDHCGGASRWAAPPGEGPPPAPEDAVPEFPRARYAVQRREWEDACANRSHMRTTYRPENLAPLARSGRLLLLEGETEVVPGLRVRVTPGHTRAHQSVLLRSAGECALYPGDLCPTSAHLHPMYNMAYDMEPYVTMQTKGTVLAEAAREGWPVFFDHDPEVRVARLRPVERGYEALPLGPGEE